MENPRVIKATSRRSHPKRIMEKQNSIFYTPLYMQEYPATSKGIAISPMLCYSNIIVIRANPFFFDGLNEAGASFATPRRLA